ncbi:MAG: hypothetical protein HYV63_18650 [Candidatus Schekmanbacteria bacterium]|nr:hypothetical protein [Candidatus Schekmanbacteria bacterium]
MRGLVALGAVLFVGWCGAVLAGTVDYSYDAAGRLVAVTYDGAKTVAYTYDAAGNLTERRAGESVVPALGAVAVVAGLAALGVVRLRRIRRVGRNR